MSDFTINIDSKLDLSKARSEMNSFLSEFKNEPIKINVELDPKSINTTNFGKQIQSSFSSAGTNAGKAFTKNMESSINSTNINKLVSRLNAKGISKDIVSGAEKSLNTLTKAGIQINKIKEVFSGDNLVSLKIDGVDSLGNAVSVIDKLNKKTKEFVSTTTYTTSFKDISKDAENAKSKLLSLDEIKTRLFKAQGNVGSLQAQFGNVDKFSQDFNELGISIKNALSQVDNGDSSKLSSVLAEIEGKVKTLTTSTREWHKVNQTEADITASSRKYLEDTERAVNKQKELQSALIAFKKQNSTLFDPKSENYSSSIVDEFSEVENAINRISSISSTKIASNMFSGLRASVKTATEEIKTESSELEKVQDKFANAQSKFNSIQSAFSKSSQSVLGTNGYNQIQAYLNQATSAMERFNAEARQGENANLDSLNADMKEFISLTNRATSEYNKLNAPASVVKQQNTLNEFQRWMNKNSKAYKAGGTRYNSIISSLQGNLTGGQLEEAISQIKSFKTEMELTGNVGLSFSQEMGRGMKVIGQFATTYGIIQRIPETIMNMANAVIEVDTAMTNLYKVTDETDAKYSEFLSNASKNAKSLGRDISSYITQTSEWAKLGYSMDSSSELAKVSSIYANVGEVDDKTAVSDLVTVMKAYNMQDSQAMNIADMLNELGNNYATSAGDLGAGLTKMASTMSMSNVSLEKSLAILTGGTEITQNAEELGNAIKISVLRMRGQKGKLESLGENADDIESVSKMQTQILNMTKGAVNIMDSADPTKFRDYYDVMADIAEILPKLNQTDQSNLIETLFGKNRANQGQAILQAFQSGQIQKAYQTALNSAGSAQKEQDRWLQSAEAKIQQFKAQFQSLSTTAIDSNVFKGLIDSGTTLLNILTQLIDVGGGIPLMLGAIGGTAFIKNLDLFYFKLVTSYKRMQRKWCCKQLCVVTF